jgi:hypothetical protein
MNKQLMLFEEQEIKTRTENEGLINEFRDRLLYEEYKVILYNGQTPILYDDTGIIDLIISDLDEESIVEINNDKLVIHIKNNTIELTEYKEMSDYEIFARQYLDECGDSYLIIKDNEMQVEMREDNFHEVKSFYKKCKDIINIRGFLGYDADSSIYKMNWDAIWVYYNDGSKELWQRP